MRHHAFQPPATKPNTPKAIVEAYGLCQANVDGAPCNLLRNHGYHKVVKEVDGTSFPVTISILNENSAVRLTCTSLWLGYVFLDEVQMALPVLVAEDEDGVAVYNWANVVGCQPAPEVREGERGRLNGS